MRCISVKIMVISVRQKKCFLSQHVSQPFLKKRKCLLDMRKDFLIMSNFYLAEIFSEPNSLTIVTSKKILTMSNYVPILSIIFFLITRIMNLQCNMLKPKNEERNFKKKTKNNIYFYNETKQRASFKCSFLSFSNKCSIFSYLNCEVSITFLVQLILI